MIPDAAHLNRLNKPSEGAERIRTAASVPTPERDKAPQIGVIYVVQAECGGPVKIGYCGSPAAQRTRLASLQTGNPHKLRMVHAEPGTVEDERLLHREFRDYRMCGEWFRAHYKLQERFPGLAYEHDDVTEASVMYDKGYSDGWDRGFDDAAACDRCGERALCECPETPADRERERRITEATARARYYALHGSERGYGRRLVPR